MNIAKHRLQALFTRHLYPLRRDFDLLSDMIYWPLVDTVLWGVTGTWLTETSGVPELVVALLMGLVIWNIIWRSQSEVGRNMMDEIWNSNLVNLFSTPVSVVEWLISVIGLSFIKTMVTLLVVVPVMFFLYSINVLSLGLWLPVFFFLASMTGWSVGLLASGIVLRWGPRVQTVIWTLPGILLPFSAIYFPAARLPGLLQTISWFVPTTYVMETLRAVVFGGTVDPWMLVKSLALNIVYLTLASWIFLRSFTFSKKMGLNRFT